MSFEFSSLFDGARERRVAEDATVFHAGASITHVFFVRDGCAVLVRPLASGDAAYLQRARAGDVVAEASAYADSYHCDCTALEPTVLALLPRKEFRQALRADAELSETWAAHLARTVQSTRMRAEIRSLKTVSDRLDAWLAEYGPLPEKGQWQGVAQELSVSREALYRELANRRSG
ncbi:MAG: Crp/Fnr family transcriptional regulator [Rhodobacteraceae bacterium]|nr:Crp/Fnr family transcriptional regulator [Paracoccaceae bacterium]